MTGIDKSKEKWLVVVGLTLVGLGLLLNEWGLTALFSSDGVVAFEHRIVIWCGDILLIAAGVSLVIYRRRLKKEWFISASGFALMIAGVVLNEYVVSVLLGMDPERSTKTVIIAVDIYLIATGAFIIWNRHSLDLRQSVVYGITSVICLGLFLAFDFSKGYAHIRHLSDTVPRTYNVHAKDERLGWKPKANSKGRQVLEDNFDVTYLIDQNGFKKINNSDNPEFSLYFFGDSFTFGSGVTNLNTFPNIIKNRYLKKDVNVYNAGVMGYSIVQMYQRFLDIEPRIQESDLVLFTPISSDIKRNNQDYVSLILKDFIAVDYLPFYSDGTVSYHKLEHRLIDRLTELSFYAPYTGELWKSIHGRFVPDQTEDQIEMTVNILEEVRARTEAKSAAFVLIFLPHVGECLNQEYDVDLSSFDYVDIMDYFPSEEKELISLMFQDDHHWNAKGHTVAAKAIVHALIEEKVIKKNYFNTET